MEVVENSYINLEEVKEEVFNILIFEIVEFQVQVNELNRKLWEKVLSKDNLIEEEVKQFEIFDKFLFLEVNFFGIMVENRDFNIIEELIGYFFFLFLRVLKIVEEERDLVEFEKDFKIVVEKIKFLNFELRIIDDYFIDEFLED